MGLCRTRNGTVGKLAVILRWPVPLLAALMLAGCKAVPQIAGLVSGGAVGVASGSPALGFAVGVATDAAASAGVQYYGRSRQRAEQDAIATAAGDLGVGGRASWRIDHTIPIGNERGELQVTRTVENDLAVCKEIVFSVDESVDEKRKRAWYTAMICHQQDQWKWASAEPAVERWGYLQ